MSEGLLRGWVKGGGQAAVTVFLVGCGHGVSPQMPAGTGTTGLTPLACKTGDVPCSVITSVKEKGFSWRFCRAQLLSECPGSVNCMHTALHPDPHLERGSLLSGIPRTAEGSCRGFPPGCRVRRCRLSFPSQLRRAERGDAMRVPEVSQ